MNPWSSFELVWNCKEMIVAVAFALASIGVHSSGRSKFQRMSYLLNFFGKLYA